MLFFKKDFLLSFHSLTREDAFFMSQNNRHPYRAMALMSSILSSLVGSILIGIFLGRWADRHFETEPVLMIIGLLLGLSVGVYALIQTVNDYFSGE
jgi:ATP synthase protein I